MVREAESTRWWLEMDDFVACRTDPHDDDRRVDVGRSTVKTMEDGEEREVLDNLVCNFYQAVYSSENI
jgi:hypothetical protein